MRSNEVPVALALPGFATMVGSYRLWAQADCGVLTKVGISVILGALFLMLVRAVTGTAEDLPC